MSSGPHPFKKTDLARALRAAKEAGLPVERVEIEPTTGKISIITKQGEVAAPADELKNWMEKHADQAKGH